MLGAAMFEMTAQFLKSGTQVRFGSLICTETNSRVLVTRRLIRRESTTIFRQLCAKLGGESTSVKHSHDLTGLNFQRFSRLRTCTALIRSHCCDFS